MKKEQILTIKIDYNEAISAEVFYEFLGACSRQFEKQSKYYNDKQQDKLLIKEIRQGSIEIELIALIMPIIGNFNSIYTFFDSIKTTFEWFVNNNGDKPQMKIKDCEDFKRIISPLNNSNSTQINVYVNGDNNRTLLIDKEMAESMSKKLDKEIFEQQKTSEDSDNYNNVLLKLIQIKNDDKDNKNTKGIIEKIDRKEHPILFSDNSIKNEMLYNQANPFFKYYLVNVLVNKNGAKIISYTILDLLDTSVIEKEIEKPNLLENIEQL